jgi:hypothetical protein
VDNKENIFANFKNKMNNELLEDINMYDYKNQEYYNEEIKQNINFLLYQVTAQLNRCESKLELLEMFKKQQQQIQEFVKIDAGLHKQKEKYYL